MVYDEAFWDLYTSENEARYNAKFSSLIRDIAISLQCRNVLEIGCGTGIDLRLVPDAIRVCGADLHRIALDVAQTHMPQGDFVCADIVSLPFGDRTVDMIFTHQLLNYLDATTLEAGISEMHRISAGYVLSCEAYGPDGKVIRGAYRYRDMAQWWNRYNVDIIYDYILSPEIDDAKLLLLKIKR